VSRKAFFKKNIGTTGRLVRATLGIAILIAAFLVPSLPIWVRAMTGVCGGFVLFEAVRGWCLLRACGLKTKL
jgi:hypothetical protein